MSNLRQGKALFIAAACGMALLSAACMSGRTAPETYTSRSGTVTTIETDRESCVRSCNNDFERCTDRQVSAPSPYGNEAMPKPFGVEADCRYSLKNCLAGCKGR
ncbi:MAG: hypothetical protein PHY92_06405 [Alphaproteobacteria bacterium]|nr:hypothetical protein [Alphaproteobacteria bacterium]